MRAGYSCAPGNGHDGTLWLTIPTGTELNKLICEVVIEDGHWAGNHFKTLKQHDSKAPYFPVWSAARSPDAALRERK